MKGLTSLLLALALLLCACGTAVPESSPASVPESAAPSAPESVSQPEDASASISSDGGIFHIAAAWDDGALCQLRSLGALADVLGSAVPKMHRGFPCWEFDAGVAAVVNTVGEAGALARESVPTSLTVTARTVLPVINGIRVGDPAENVAFALGLPETAAPQDYDDGWPPSLVVHGMIGETHCQSYFYFDAACETLESIFLKYEYDKADPPVETVAFIGINDGTYTVTDDSGEIEAIARRLVELELADLSAPAENRSFTLTGWRNLEISPPVPFEEAWREQESQLSLFARYMRCGQWHFTYELEFCFEGEYSPIGSAENAPGWHRDSTAAAGAGCGRVITRVGNRYTMRSGALALGLGGDGSGVPMRQTQEYLAAQQQACRTP